MIKKKSARVRKYVYLPRIDSMGVATFPDGSRYQVRKDGWRHVR